jgi:uncharacterized membrane protein YozB (DUF420 family)
MPVVVSQITLALMFVALGIALSGIGYGFLLKTKERLLQHRWQMTIAIGLVLAAIFLVMFPSLYAFYSDPDLEVFSSLSIMTMIHAIVGGPTITIAIIYAFGDLPQKVKIWMRRAAVLWIASLILGTVLFLQMLDVLPIFM